MYIIIKITEKDNFDDIQSKLFNCGYYWRSPNPYELKNKYLIDYIILEYPYISQCSKYVFNAFYKNNFIYFNNFNEYELNIRKQKLIKIYE